MSGVSGVDILNRIGCQERDHHRIVDVGDRRAQSGVRPVSASATFAMVLASFFIIALGFSLQQTAAQPFTIALGSPETGAHRLNLAGGINSLGTLLGPLAVSCMLFGDLQNGGTATIQSIQTPTSPWRDSFSSWPCSSCSRRTSHHSPGRARGKSSKATNILSHLHSDGAHLVLQRPYTAADRVCGHRFIDRNTACSSTPAGQPRRTSGLGRHAIPATGAGHDRDLRVMSGWK